MATPYSSLLVFWIVSFSRIYAQDVIFGTTGASGETCTTKEGRRGQCIDIRKCPIIRRTYRTNPPVLCGFNGAFPIVCCPANTEPVSEGPIVSPIPVLDISSPDFSPDFECGKSPVKTIIIDSGISRFKRSIIGGVEAERQAYPWMALIRGTVDGIQKWFCGGSLINDQWVLTAAHCFDDAKPEFVRLGEHDYEDNLDGANHKDFEILKIVRHPNYAVPVAYHDLALIQLASKVTLQTYIAPVCLPWGKESKKDLTNTKVKATGWGDTEYLGNPSSVLQEVDVTVFANSKCQENYSTLRDYKQTWPNGIGEETVCAGDLNGGRDACQGDSGGPITYRANNGRYTIKGVVSTGYGCGFEGYPGIYANVQYPSHLAWIKKVAF